MDQMESISWLHVKKQKNNNNKNQAHYLPLLYVCGQIEFVVTGRGAGLYPWTLGSRHEWSWEKEVTVVLLKGVKERWVCLLIAVEQVPHLEQAVLW